MKPLLKGNVRLPPFVSFVFGAFSAEGRKSSSSLRHCSTLLTNEESVLQNVSSKVNQLENGRLEYIPRCHDFWRRWRHCPRAPGLPQEEVGECFRIIRRLLPDWGVGNECVARIHQHDGHAVDIRRCGAVLGGQVLDFESFGAGRQELFQCHSSVPYRLCGSSVDLLCEAGVDNGGLFSCEVKRKLCLGGESIEDILRIWACAHDKSPLICGGDCGLASVL